MKKKMYSIFNNIQNNHWWFRGRKHIIHKLLLSLYPESVKKKKIKICEVGCGAGLMIPVLKKLGKLTLVDYSSESIRLCKENFSIKVIKGKLPDNFKLNQKFDLIILLDVLEHIDRDKEALSVLKTHLKKHGYLVLTVPAYNFLWSSHDENCMHFRRYSKSSLLKSIESSGLIVHKISYFNFFLFPIAFVSRIFSRLFNFKINELTMPNKFINNILFFVFKSESIFLKKFNLPFGLSLLAIIRKNSK